MTDAALQTVIMGALVVLLFLAVVLMAEIAMQLKAMRREAEATRAMVAKMDWGVLLFNNVQQLKAAVEALGQIEKRLQKLEEIQKVQLSNINIGVRR